MRRFILKLPQVKLMTEDKIKEYFAAAHCLILEQTDSTNNVARTLAREGAGEYTCVVARRQTGGRGRLGRTFFSPESGVYLSVVLRPQISPQQCLFITVAAAVAAAEAIERISGRRVLIKWVNDIYIDGKKVCGILTEGATDGEKLDFAVLGLGVNLFAPADGFPSEIESIAGCVLNERPSDDTKARLIGTFLQIFSKYYEKLEDKEYLKSYQRLSFLQGKEVTYEREGQTFCGTVCGIDENAALLVECDGVINALSTGEVQITDFQR